MNRINEKLVALGRHLIDEDTDLEPSSYDDCMIDTDCGEFLVLTDYEADQRVNEYIAETVWAFNADFLAAHISDLDADDINAIRGDKCESINNALRRLIDDFDHFVEDAISADGRGHFLSGYDGEEIELRDADGSVAFYAYRTN